MKDIKSLTEELKTLLDEKLLNVSDRSVSFPKSDQVVILAGGAGSGKGFVLQYFLGIEGKVIDSDSYKQALLDYYTKFKKDSKEKIEKDFREVTGRYLASIKLTDPVDVSILHEYIKEKGWVEKRIMSFFLGQSTLKHKSNVIFDVTLKDTKKLKEISNLAQEFGYKKENIHIVWVLTDYHLASKQNKQRGRMVSNDILFKTHRGVSLTLKEIISNSNEYRDFADGNIFLFFNKADVDNTVTPTDNNNYIVNDYTAIQLKEKNKPANYDEIESEVIEKINNYVPDETSW